MGEKVICYNIRKVHDGNPRSLPSMFPGLPSVPKRLLFPKAPASLAMSPALPSKPRIRFASVTCNPLANCSTFSLRRPSLST